MYIVHVLARVYWTRASTCIKYTCQHVYDIHMLARVLYTRASTCTIYMCQHMYYIHVLARVYMHVRAHYWQRCPRAKEEIIADCDCFWCLLSLLKENLGLCLWLQDLLGSIYKHFFVSDVHSYGSMVTLSFYCLKNSNAVSLVFVEIEGTSLPSAAECLWLDKLQLMGPIGRRIPQHTTSIHRTTDEKAQRGTSKGFSLLHDITKCPAIFCQNLHDQLKETE